MGDVITDKRKQEILYRLNSEDRPDDLWFIEVIEFLLEEIGRNEKHIALLKKKHGKEMLDSMDRTSYHAY
jgi:hypothetical protein